MSDTTTELEPKQAATGTAAALQQDDGLLRQTNGFLALFQRKPIPPDKAAQLQREKADREHVKSALEAAKRGHPYDYIQAAGKASEEGAAKIQRKLLKSKSAEALFVADPKFGGRVLSSADPQLLRTINFDKFLGKAKDDVLGAAVVEAARKAPLKNTSAIDRQNERDPEVFALLAGKIGLTTWNDSSGAIGAKKRDLATRTYQALWHNGGYDQICKLIELGVKTTSPAIDDDATGKGVYSGFVQPLQHMIQNSLHDVARLDQGGLPQERDAEAKGAKKIFAALDKAKSATTVTKWSDVEGSELVKAFKKEPGTIWGFENIREPYVEAAHETDQGGQPVRMLEIWDAVMEVLDNIGTPDAYSKFLDKPASKAAECVAAALKKVEAGQKDGKGKYGLMAGWSKEDEKAYREAFERDAAAFLKEFAAQMPKGMFARVALDEQGNPNQRGKRVSELAGISTGKLTGGLACKAGLWWAKGQGKPVYYCLDGIDMKDVTDYKKVKNAAIERYLAAGSKGARHDEVITMVELREILKNWDELKDTVKFVHQGEMISPQQAEKDVTEWQRQMQAANKAAGRAKAPPRATFANELKALDPDLLGRLQDDEEGDKDARDIVRKSTYLAKVANVRPDMLLKYILNKCNVLVEYDLISETTIAAAKIFSNLANDDDAPDGKIKQVASNLIESIGECNAKFQEPLKQALVRHPLVERANRKKKVAKS